MKLSEIENLIHATVDEVEWITDVEYFEFTPQNIHDYYLINGHFSDIVQEEAEKLRFYMLVNGISSIRYDRNFVYKFTGHTQRYHNELGLTTTKE